MTLVILLMIVSETSIGQGSLTTTQRFPKTLIYNGDTVVAYTLNQEKDIFQTYIERNKYKELYNINEKIILNRDSTINGLKYNIQIQENIYKLQSEEQSLMLNQSNLYKDKIDILTKDIDKLHEENNILHNRYTKIRKQRNKLIIISITSTVGLFTALYFTLK